MDIGWYYNRLRLMSLGEILYRLKRLSWQLFAKTTRNYYEEHYKRTASKTTRIVDMIGQVRFYGLDDINQADISEPWTSNAIANADKLLDHQYSCYGIDKVDLGKEIKWNREYKRNIDTPLEFAPWMDYRDTAKYGHFKYFWELGRFQHLITFAKVYSLTGKEKYAQEVSNQIKSFVKQCPYLLGVHWTMAMETGLRLISITWIVAFMKEYLKKDIETCSLIEEIIRSHIDYTAKNLSLHSSANNHLIGEITGLFIAGVCFGDVKGITKHKQKAYDMLCKEINLQFHSDGVNREQTTHYHVSCYNCFLLAGILGRDNGLNFPKEYWKTLEKGAEFICSLSNEDNSIFNIGDSDGGKTIVLSDSDYNQVQSLLSTTAALFKRSDFKSKAKFFDEMSFWLLGKKGKATFSDLASDNNPGGSKKFEEGGYYILQSNGPSNPKIIFDCGPLGFGDIAAHGHADSLSFMLYAYNREFFIDPGTYIFEAENPYRNYFRSTAAHNTITVDDMDQSEMKGPFLWNDKAISHIEEWVDTEEHVRVVGWHDGYRRLTDPVNHRRSIELDKLNGIVTINDSIEAKAIHEVCQNFHLAPECQAIQTENNCWDIINKGKMIKLIIDNQFRSQLVRGNEDPICGWASESYDNKVPINTLVAKASTQGNHSFTTQIFL